MSDDFYRAFEEKYRGSRELVKSRLQAYLAFVSPLADLDRGARTVDLGCGRGEWLELMTEVGLTPCGVDMDDGMLSACLERNLHVTKGDAIAFLATLPNESQVIVSAFHFVEHISFEHLQTVVSEALRVLKPGGLLIMETPNPENIIVATCNFYLDPTHQRPLPPQLLSFIPAYYGFARVKTIRLQEPENLFSSTLLTLHDVLGGVSPDYAVIAQKEAAADVFHTIDAAFEHEYGLSLTTLAARYQVQAETRAQQASKRVAEAEAHAQQASELTTLAEARAQQANERVAEAEAQAQQASEQVVEAEAHARQATEQTTYAEAHAQQLQNTLHTFANSRSWRVTGPLRWFGLQVRRFSDSGFLPRTKALVKKTARPLIDRCLAFFDTRPSVKNQVVALVRRVGLYGSLRSLYRRVARHNHLMPATGYPYMPNQTNELSQLTPKAREIYAKLKVAIKNKQDSC